MADKTTPAVPKLQADTSKATEGLQMAAPAVVQHNPDEYLLTGPDGLDFNVGVATYKRVFEDNKDFTVKEEPKKK